MFRINWGREVEILVLELWLMAEGNLQKRISAAVIKIEERLSANPLDEGESRTGDVRVAFESPIGIKYTVDLDDHVVTIIDFWLYT